MAMIKSLCKLLVTAAKRALAGFVAGFIVACLVLVVLDRMPPHGDLGYHEFQKWNRAVSLAFRIGCVVAFISVLAGGMRVSRYWYWLCVTFGVIWLIPFWPRKGGLFPFGTVYVNWRLCEEYRIRCLAVHVVISLLLAAIVHPVYSRFRGKDRGTASIPK